LIVSVASKVTCQSTVPTKAGSVKKSGQCWNVKSLSRKLNVGDSSSIRTQYVPAVMWRASRPAT